MMVNPKNICISACAGFVLSFVIGLISGVAFGSVIIRALIFAAVFAALSVGISFLYATFLSDTVKSSNPSDSEDAAHKPVTGGVVNIVVDDSTLADDADSPKFAVGQGNKAIIKDDSEVQLKTEEAPSPAPVAAVKDEPVRSASEAVPAEKKDVTSAAEPNGGFVPSSLNTMTKTEQTEAPQTVESQGEAVSAASGSPEEQLDALPDIGQLNISSGSSEASVIGDSDFATGGKSSSPSDSVASTGQDTNTMAQAIRTLLASDN